MMGEGENDDTGGGYGCDACVGMREDQEGSQRRAGRGDVRGLERTRKTYRCVCE